ncbi:uncharacterized protein LOC110455927 [Mizuhopecten yessoensis]|uniref:Uncharacterized protein n=1 Tax=Mizuhopecten yessoensis TaxID=6573 RepID=A0A210QC43_MIZYE|nr:uncharacterized protein LOC110455927 [Mizuhopecten yessoensis]XP_021362037.1 uncharacterized protein LOC110455927 [Mizuhopecten yessoensis]XP_021362038.1 uncharacterized protein LOC110455927 [Mizuhopecten yessoensis]OWF46307.1 hypothetical protein KP79_PYT16993 [Mizuhopecten yessoensis]
MPGNAISPTDSRPKTCPTYNRSTAQSRATSSRPYSRGTSHGVSHGTSNDAEEENEEYHVELLEYEWPDLPPLPRLKDAITRQKVSRGISYLLPVDKGKNSINNRYRTDLRAMFQEPYANDDCGYDDNKVKLSAQIHFDTNTVSTKWSQRHFDSIPFQLNSESEKARRMYVRSAPARAGRQSGMDMDKMRTRSSLFLPMKKEEHPEAAKLREEVKVILQSVQTEAESDSDSVEGETYQRRKSDILRPRRGTITYRNSVGTAGMLPKKPRVVLTAENYKTYEDLKRTKTPKTTIPEPFQSKFLSVDENQHIWEWLHHGEEMSDFQFFLSVCG